MYCWKQDRKCPYLKNGKCSDKDIKCRYKHKKKHIVKYTTIASYI